MCSRPYIVIHLMQEQTNHITLYFSFSLTVRPRGRLAAALGVGHHESSVHRNPYESHSAYDAIRTQDADLAVRPQKITREKIVKIPTNFGYKLF